MFRRRRRVLVGAVLLVVVAGAVGGPVAGLLDSDDDFDPPAAEAVQAREAIAQATGASATPDVIALVRLGARRLAAGQAGCGASARRRGPGGRARRRYRPAVPPSSVSTRRPLELRRDTLRDGADADAVVERLEDRAAASRSAGRR